MDFVQIILISIGLAMDAFAVSVCKGLTFKSMSFKNTFIIALYFGFFQGIMPVFGYFLGNIFGNIMSVVDHYVVFILLGLIGFNMIKDVFSKNEDNFDDKVNFQVMFPLAVATSIDAFSIGITLAFLKVNLFVSVLIIGIITLCVTFIGVLIGNRFGLKYGKVAQVVGGIILILMGLKVLLEHLGLFII